MAFNFEKLTVWQLALDLSSDSGDLTKSFPKEEIYVLTSQIKRAADSIALNIAEGSTGQSNPEQIKFLGYSLRSAIEVVACLHIAKKRELIDENQFMKLYNQTEMLIVKIQAFRKTLK